MDDKEDQSIKSTGKAAYVAYRMLPTFYSSEHVASKFLLRVE